MSERAFERHLSLVVTAGFNVEESFGVRKEIWPVTQSTNGLWRVSQLYPRTAEAGESRVVT